MVDLGAIEEDVPFDDGAADALVAACTAAASLVEGQFGSRSSWVSTASKDFRGYFAGLFVDNATTAHGDGQELVTALRNVAGETRYLKQAAAREQQRRLKARKWKHDHDHRNLLQKGIDLFGGEDSPPVGPPDPEPYKAVAPPPTRPRKTPAPGSGGGGGGTSSARPADLERFATNSSHANSVLSSKSGSCRGALSHFTATCHWGSLDASGVMTGFDKWLTANDEDVKWANVVAAAFARAGGQGAVSTLSNSAIAATLRAHGVSAARQDLSIDPPQAFGHPPTTGYAVDPVNTSTGNFIETESDLGFAGSCAGLEVRRTYNSLNSTVGGFGPGWSSWTEAGVAVDDEGASVRLVDGRVINFPRLGSGWDRAAGEALWLERADDEGAAAGSRHGWRMGDNTGGMWEFAPTGALVSVSTGPGTTVELKWDDGRLLRLVHERGRWVDLEWSEPDSEVGSGLNQAARVVGLRASDGRQVKYSYDGQGRLVAATSGLGTRSYQWDEQSLLSAVVDADGVLEAENVYDEHGRVARQRTQHDRVTRFAYLAGRVTVVSDEDGGRSNTWVADERGRLVGVVDADEQRQSMSYDEFGNPVLVTERDGAVTVNEHDQRGRIIHRVTPSAADLRWSWDEYDRVTSVAAVAEEGEPPAVTRFEYDDDLERSPSLLIDAEGGRTEMSWVAGLLTRIVDPTGVVVRFAYDVHGELVATTDASGNTARLDRDRSGRVIAAVTPSGHVTRFGYHPVTGLLATRTDPDGGVWAFEHSAAGRLQAKNDPLGARTEVEYDTHGEATRSIDPLGRAVSRGFDDLGNLASVELPDGTTWGFTHDAMSRLTQVLDATGGSWRREYDAVGDLVAMAGPDGETTRVDTDRASGTTQLSEGTVGVADPLAGQGPNGPMTAGIRVDRLGRLIAETQQDGTTALIRYDRCGRAVEVIDPAGGLTRMERDPAGRVLVVQKPSGARQSYAYDQCGRLASVVDETGVEVRLDYDADGRVEAQHLPDGEVATTRYDECGRVVARRVPGMGTTTWSHDLAGRVTETRDPQFGRRRFRYDPAGQLVEAVDGNGGITGYEYDANCRVVAITHPDGGVTRREYDAMNRLVAETDPLGRTTRAGYDGAGRQTWQTDPTGTRTEWRYDASGRLERLIVDGVEMRSVERDLPGRRLRITDRSGPDGGIVTHELEWDPRGLLVGRTRDGRGPRWEYDADGHRSAMVQLDGSRVTYTRDGAGRLLAVDHPLLGRAVLQRDGFGRVLSATAGALSESWNYAEGFVVAHESSGTQSVHTELERDDDGRIVALAHDGLRTEFDYDAACQLISAHTVTTEGGSVARWRYDAAGRLVAETVDGIVRDLSYDVAGQLLATSVGGEEVAGYSYDAMGRRTGEAWADGSHRDYAWSPEGWLAEVGETDRTGRNHRRRLGVDALGELAHVDGVEVFSDTADPLASLVQFGDRGVVRAGPLTATAGAGWAAAGWRALRATGADPWTVEDAGVDVGFTATGDFFVAGLEWLGARAWDPGTRGFLSTDPLDPVTGAGWAGNPYSYAGNDPLHALDPLGLRPATDADLKAYTDAHQGAIHAAGHWMKDNWEYVAGGAMVIAGGVLIATGVGGPAGMMLVSAGASTIIQKATTGQVNWGEVALSGALGGIGGGAASWAARASEGGVAALRTTVLVNGGVGALSSEGMYGYRVATGQQDFSAQGLVANGLTGGIAGGVGAAAGPAGGTIAKALGAKSTGLMAQTATGGINFAGGFGANVAGSALTGQDIDLTHAAASGTFAAGAGAVGPHISPSARGTDTLNQMSYFGTRTPSGLANFSGTNTRALWGGAATGAGMGIIGP